MGGDEIGPKDDKTIRIYFQNIQGIKLIGSKPGDWIDFQDKIKDMDDLAVDIMAWAETNVMWSKALSEKAKMFL
eukprot:3663969-Ditylum_brightwellii.AAC.1